jgi:hypothetical protein
MRDVRVRRRRDGVTEIAPRTRLGTAALAAVTVLAAAPVLLSVIAVLPAIALALPPLLIAAALYPAWRRMAS